MANKSPTTTMRTTLEKYNRLCDRAIIDKSKYDINARVEMIMQEILSQLREWEQDAIDIYGPLKTPLKSLRIFG